MLKVGFLLHFYQPSTQFTQTLEKITLRSYEPLLSLFDEFPQAGLTVNLTGSLLELWEQSGRDDLLKHWRTVVERGRVEVVGTAKYHPILFKLPVEEVERQIWLQEGILQRVLGLAKPQGFFPPEMSYSRTVAEAVAKRGYRWIVVDRSARPGSGFPGEPERSLETQSIARLPLGVVFRDPALSYRVAFAVIRNVKGFNAAVDLLNGRDGYVILAMDAETFGWHRKTQLGFLRSLLKESEKTGSKFKLEPISRIFEEFPFGTEIDPLESSWSFFRETAAGVRVFPRWDNPENPVHNLQWRLLKLALEASRLEPDGSTARKLLDQGEQSDQFWWASADPCWLPPMVKAGADLLERSVMFSSRSSEEQKNEAARLSVEIADVGSERFGKKPKRC